MLSEMVLGGCGIHHMSIQPSVTSQQTCPRAQHSLISLKKTHKIQPNQSSPRDKDGSGSMWVDDVGCAALPHTLARQQVWP